ncbi:hypothetical protein [Rickettsia felis]|uniref:hypothetical protein n=1 Tax=Rickettsia felis TaxID=42862 RepID=UPI000A52F4FA|nr:hypothetical protein [Rickettsia felis]
MNNHLGYSKYNQSDAQNSRNGYKHKEFMITKNTMAIGVKLGDEKTLELVGDEKIPEETKVLAERCMERIKFHKEEVYNRDVMWEEIMARGKDFDNLVKSESGHSYYDSIPNQGTVMKKWSVYVELL